MKKLMKELSARFAFAFILFFGGILFAIFAPVLVIFFGENAAENLINAVK